MKAEGEAVRLSRGDAERFVRRLFELAGVEADTASQVAAALVEAELEGTPSHGLLQAPVYVRRVLSGSIAKTAEVTLVHRSGPVSVYDSGLALGHPAAEKLAGIAVAEARIHGISAVAVKSAMHFGIAGRYARMIAGKGMVAIIMCNTRPMMPVPGGTRPVVGNNPLSIAVPCTGRDPIVFDMAMSASALGRIRQAAREGQPIPAGWAVDAEGRDTTDAQAAIDGMLLPAGGAKGFGLALMIDFLCALSGGAAGSELGPLYGPPDVRADGSWLMLALDPARFGLDQAYAERVAALAGVVSSSAPEPTMALPGDRKRAARTRAQEKISLTAKLAASLGALSKELGGEPLPGTEN